MKWRKGDLFLTAWVLGLMGVALIPPRLSWLAMLIVGLVLGTLSDIFLRRISDRYRSDNVNGPNDWIVILTFLQTLLFIGDIVRLDDFSMINGNSRAFVAPFMVATCFSQWASHRRLSKQ